jgi:uncharacterized protein YndB with AHSA1/START domain
MNRNSFEPSPLAAVDLPAADDDRWTLVLVRDLAHPPEAVWAALTDPVRLAEWAPFLADRDLGVVGDTTLTMVDGATRQAMAASVLRAEPPSLLAYTWGPDLLQWQLRATATGTRLTLRHTIADREAAPMMAAGWHLCLDVAGHLLDGHPIGPIRGSAAMDFGWSDLRSAYALKLNISGSP